jgi:hypothetical protein
MVVAGKRNCCRLYRRQLSGIGSKAKKLLCALAYCTILDHLESPWAGIADSRASASASPCLLRLVRFALTRHSMVLTSHSNLFPHDMWLFSSGTFCTGLDSDSWLVTATFTRIRTVGYPSHFLVETDSRQNKEETIWGRGSLFRGVLQRYTPYVETVLVLPALQNSSDLDTASKRSFGH